MIPGNRGRIMQDSKRRRLTRIYDDEALQVLELGACLHASWHVPGPCCQALAKRSDKEQLCKVHMKMVKGKGKTNEDAKCANDVLHMYRSRQTRTSRLRQRRSSFPRTST